jgi:hypothetical protein
MNRWVAFALLLPLAAQAAETLPSDALSPEALRAMSQKAEDSAQSKKERASATQPSASIPATPADSAASGVPQADKYRTPPTTNNSSYNNAPRYNPASASQPSSGGVVKLDVAKPKGTKYGVRLGTIIQGEIRRNVSSAESGLTEIWITKDVVGDKRVIPAGTQLFATKHVNTATKRLEFLTVNGITPDGDEFQMNARVYDVTQVSGLSGIVNDMTDEIAKKGFNRGLITAGSSALRGVTVGPAADAINAGANSMLTDTEQRLQAETNTNIVVYVSPQSLLLRVDKTF